MWEFVIKINCAFVGRRLNGVRAKLKTYSRFWEERTDGQINKPSVLRC
jgi:hypothetical protein